MGEDDELRALRRQVRELQAELAALRRGRLELEGELVVTRHQDVEGGYVDEAVLRTPDGMVFHVWQRNRFLGVAKLYVEFVFEPTE